MVIERFIDAFPYFLMWNRYEMEGRQRPLSSKWCLRLESTKARLVVSCRRCSLDYAIFSQHPVMQKVRKAPSSIRTGFRTGFTDYITAVGYSDLLSVQPCFSFFCEMFKEMVFLSLLFSLCKDNVVFCAPPSSNTVIRLDIRLDIGQQTWWICMVHASTLA